MLKPYRGTPERLFRALEEIGRRRAMRGCCIESRSPA
jgi:hypothetical protein